jgi:MFS family permease
MSSLRLDLRELPREVWIVSAGLFINKFGNFVNVFVVLYVTAQGYSPAAAGAALAVIGLGNFLGNALGGVLADRWGRRGTVMISMYGSGAVTLIAPCMSSYVAITGTLGVLGIFAQLFRPAASAIVVDSVRPDQLVTAFGLLRLAINVGMTTGPAIGGLLSSISYTWVFVGDGLTSIAFGVLATVFLRAPEIADARDASQSEQPRKSRVGYGVVLEDRRYLAYLLAMVASTYVYIQSTATLPIHVHAHGMGNEEFGILLGFNAVLVVALELPITRITRRFPARQVISFGMTLLGLGIAATGLSPTMLTLLVSVLGWSLAEMIYTPVANAYPGDVAPPGAIGRYQGAEGLAHTLGATLGPVVGGALFALSPEANWITCLAVALLGAGLMRFARPAAGALAAAPVLVTPAT